MKRKIINPVPYTAKDFPHKDIEVAALHARMKNLGLTVRKLSEQMPIYTFTHLQAIFSSKKAVNPTYLADITEFLDKYENFLNS